MSNNTGGPAFPAPAGVAHITEQGMTLRDYFAAKALQGLMGGRWKSDVHGHKGECSTAEADEWAKNSYKFADAMLKAREA